MSQPREKILSVGPPKMETMSAPCAYTERVSHGIIRGRQTYPREGADGYYAYRAMHNCEAQNDMTIVTMLNKNINKNL
jgi:hypothetical protein